MREREREGLFFFFGEGKVCKEWKREWQNYNKMVWIRKDKKKKRKMKGKMKSDIKVEGSGEMKM